MVFKKTVDGLGLSFLEKLSASAHVFGDNELTAVFVDCKYLATGHNGCFSHFGQLARKYQIGKLKIDISPHNFHYYRMLPTVHFHVVIDNVQPTHSDRVCVFYDGFCYQCFTTMRSLLSVTYTHTFHRSFRRSFRRSPPPPPDVRTRAA